MPERLRNSDQFTVIGADWPSDVEITLRLLKITSSALDSIDLGSVRVDALGRFKYKGIVPPVATLGDWALVAHASDPVQIVSVPFTIAEYAQAPRTAVTPTLTLSATMTALPGTVTATVTPTVAETPPETATLTATATATASKTPVVVTATPIAISEWRGTYFNNITLSGAPALTRNDEVIDFDWKFGSPDPYVNKDNFSASWTRQMVLAQGKYRLTVRMDDGARVWVDGVRVLNVWRAGGLRRVSTTIALNQGSHDLRVDYFERAGVAAIHFTIELVGAPAATPVPTASSTPTPTAVPLPTDGTPTAQP